MKGLIFVAGAVALLAAPLAVTTTATSKDGYLENVLVCTKMLFEDPEAHARNCGGTAVPSTNSLSAPVTSSKCYDMTVSMLPEDYLHLPETLLASDFATKCEASVVNEFDGLPVYRFKYIGSDQVFYGLMVDDVLADGRFKEAVVTLPNGYRALNYGAIGLDVPDEAAMRAAGERAMAILGPRHS